jgi:phosphate starvation-inducible protein PhoH and related proteins
MKKEPRNTANRKNRANEGRDTSELVPLNDLQKSYISAIKHNPFVICTGVWGSSKTYIPSVLAADMLMSKENPIERIIVARPTEGKGKSVGFLKGGKDEKLEPWVAPVADTIKKRIGLGNYEMYLKNGKIELVALEHIKGRSWDNAFILVDEAEDLDPEVAKSLVGRQGINSKIVVTGDIAQQDLKRNSGLELLLKVSEFREEPVVIIDFSSWDHCVRSDEAKQWGMAFEAYEKKEKSTKGSVKPARFIPDANTVYGVDIKTCVNS